MNRDDNRNYQTGFDPMDAPSVPCGYCSGEIYKGAKAYLWHFGKAGKKPVHPECLRELINDMSDNQLAELIGAEMIIALDDMEER
jgi:hypothetical protein